MRQRADSVPLIVNVCRQPACDHTTMMEAGLNMKGGYIGLPAIY